MNAVNFLAELWGISLAIICFALLLNPKKIQHIWRSVESESFILLAGMLTLVLGIASVLSYNVWSKDWTIIITILGWATLIKGLVLLFMPAKCQEWYKKIEANPNFISMGMVLGIIIGCVLIYCGFAF